MSNSNCDACRGKNNNCPKCSGQSKLHIIKTHKMEYVLLILVLALLLELWYNHF